MEFFHHLYVWDYDVCKQLRGGRTSFLVLGFVRLGILACPETVSFKNVCRWLWLTIYRLKRVGRGQMQVCIWSIAFLTSLRVIRGWNQTGQKHAGEPDIAKTFLPAHNFVLWGLIGLTYFDFLQRLARIIEPWASRRLSFALAFALGSIALRFKINFTKADAPELLHYLDFLLWPYLEQTSLVAQARMVFASILTLTALTFLSRMDRESGQRGNIQGSSAASVSLQNANPIIFKIPLLRSMTY